MVSTKRRQGPTPRETLCYARAVRPVVRGDLHCPVGSSARRQVSCVLVAAAVAVEGAEGEQIGLLDGPRRPAVRASASG
jgi:hypothetical protein